MPMGDKQWQAGEDLAERLRRQKAAEAESHARRMEEIRRENDRQVKENFRVQDERRADETRSHTAPAVLAPVVPPAQKKGRGGFLSFLVLVGAIILIVHAATKHDSTPGLAPVTPAHAATPAAATSIPAPPAPSQGQEEAVAPERITELTTSDDLPFYMKRPIVDGDLDNKSASELVTMGRLLLAHHGAHFTVPAVQAYFDAQPWYESSGKSGDEIRSELSAVESKNLQLIEEAAGARQ